MMNGLVVKRGEFYVARIRAKSRFYDEYGNLWSKESQAVRVFHDETMAVREARRVGGVVKRMTDGRVED